MSTTTKQDGVACVQTVLSRPMVVKGENKLERPMTMKNPKVTCDTGCGKRFRSKLIEEPHGVA